MENFETLWDGLSIQVRKDKLGMIEVFVQSADGAEADITKQIRQTIYKNIKKGWDVV